MSDNVNDLEYEINERGERTLVCSEISNLRAYLQFTNKTSRPVDIWWRDFRGLPSFYARIEPGGHYKVNSFVTHPWFFSDSCTKERFVINNKLVYRPPISIGGMMYRTNWNINVRVRSLRETAMLSLAQSLRDPDSVEALGLPRVLGDELQRLTYTIHNTPLPAEIS